MKSETALLIQEYGGEIREGYSGRGMYGEETTGIVFDDESDFFTTLAKIIESCTDKERSNVAQALRKMQMDNMGRSIIYY